MFPFLAAPMLRLMGIAVVLFLGTVITLISRHDSVQRELGGAATSAAVSQSALATTNREFAIYKSIAENEAKRSEARQKALEVAASRIKQLEKEVANAKTQIVLDSTCVQPADTARLLRRALAPDSGDGHGNPKAATAER